MNTNENMINKENDWAQDEIPLDNAEQAQQGDKNGYQIPEKFINYASAKAITLTTSRIQHFQRQKDQAWKWKIAIGSQRTGKELEL